ncbi:MAG: hypothetical protein M1829_005206 [Trizodia sp. TS-e1964]|nr:MAG: hypothetical protein M1829_005206 [Trizodia sp. TS-e1964]
MPPNPKRKERDSHTKSSVTITSAPKPKGPGKKHQSDIPQPAVDQTTTNGTSHRKKHIANSEAQEKPHANGLNEVPKNGSPAPAIAPGIKGETANGPRATIGRGHERLERQKRKREAQEAEGSTGEKSAKRIKNFPKRPLRKKERELVVLLREEEDKYIDQRPPDELAKPHTEPKILRASESLGSGNGVAAPGTALSRPEETSWRISEPVGGRFIEADPIFADNEKYIILALPSSIQIYSTQTSLLARSLRVNTSEIIAYAHSLVNPNALYSATSSGLLVLWNWVNGEKLAKWNLKWAINALAITTIKLLDQDLDLLFTTEAEQDTWFITGHTFLPGSNASERVQIYKSKSPIINLKVVADGSVILATTGSTLALGLRKPVSIASLSDVQYKWYPIYFPDIITTADIKVSRNNSSKSHGLKSKILNVSGEHVSVDVVVGDIKGVIYVYHDLLNNIIQQLGDIRNPRERVNFYSSRLHWHREAVRSAKWSLDGNYIISGGFETVLSLWQLDTNRQQFLPHLASIIDSVVVSPRGSSYAVKLADNSVIILSTSQLQPTSSIPGIQAWSLARNFQHRFGQVHTADKKDAWTTGDSSQGFFKVPCVVNPKYPTQLLLAVPSSQPINAYRSPQSPYLQTYDFSLALHISRQALTRTNATSLNIGPQSNKIAEPNVVHIKLSNDGEWLATVDEWVPPRNSLEISCLNEAEINEQLLSKREVFLKFWAWHKDDKEWSLVTRIECPHSRQKQYTIGAGLVLDLTADPTSLGFATAGEDGVVKVWKPVERTIEGVPKKGKDSESLLTWRLHFAVHTPKTISQELISESLTTTVTTHRASLSFSMDGSVLAFSSTMAFSNGPRIIYFIDTSAGKIHLAIPGLYKGQLAALAFIGRYLIILAENVTIYDSILNSVKYEFIIRAHELLAPTGRAMMSLLAADHLNGTFAVVLPRISNEFDQPSIKSVHSQLIVFDPNLPDPLYSHELTELATALMPAVSPSKGYLVFDSAACLHTVSPLESPLAISPTSVEKSLPLLLKKDEPQTNLAMLLGIDQDIGISNPGRLALAGRTNATNKLLHAPKYFASHVSQSEEVGSAEKHVVRQHQLAEVFETGPVSVLPSVGYLFDRVVNLFSQKPLKQ